jgi:CRISPR-associated protein Csd1
MVKGVTGSQLSGASLVGFNDSSFCSYGKDQSYNAPVGYSSMFKYTTVLNHLLAKREHRIRIGDSTVIFWAEKPESHCEDLVQFLFDPRDDEADPPADTTGENLTIRDRSKVQQVGDILTKVRSGAYLNKQDLGEDPDTNFYILGLSPNNARLFVRFWHVDRFGNFVVHVARHHLDMEIIRDDPSLRYISVYRLLKETVPQSSKSDAASPLLEGLLMESILHDTPYPLQMYTAILNRAKVEGKVNFIRAGFIKACLLRLSRAGLITIPEEMITMSLNEENANVPYRLGRLFAVLENVQRDTNRDIGSTITSKYFSSASSTPAVVFPVLLKLAQHHIAKSDWGFKSNRSIEEILEDVDGFPAYLSLEEQGMFMLGYYHQRKAFYRKKEDSLKEEGE